MNKFVKYTIGLAVAGVLGFGFYQKVFIPKHTFNIITPKKSDVTLKVNGVGNVGSENIYKINTIYSGTITDFNLSIGEFIHKGKMVAIIDSVDLKDKIDEVKFNIKVLQANLNSLRVDKQSAYKDYIYQLEVYKKNRRLYKRSSISELEYKKYLTTKDIAQLKVESLKNKIVSLQEQIKQLQANLKGLQARYKKYTIISPINGYITKKYVSNYDVLGNYQPLIEVVNPKDVWIDTFIDTRISGDVKIGDKADIKLRSGLKAQGYVYKINPINNAVTNEREIFVKFNKTPIPFYLNEQAIVDIKIKTLHNALTIPASAVVIYKQKQGVWVLNNNKAHFEPIKILAHSGNKVIVNLENVKIIVPNPKKKSLSEGMKIYHD